MAYSCRVQMISRSAGRSATGAAAYRAGEKLACVHTGVVHDYRKKRDVAASWIMVPKGAPDWMLDRGELWNSVEKIERRKDAQLARDFTLAIPHQLSVEQAKDLLNEWAKAQLVDRGMVADIAIHKPTDPTDLNIHAHIMTTTRLVDADGFGKKERSWNDSALLAEWRESWATSCNEAALKAGYEIGWTHKSLEDQRTEALAAGDFVRAARVSHTPTEHEGVAGRIARAKLTEEAHALGVPAEALIAERAAEYELDHGTTGLLAYNDAALAERKEAHALADQIAKSQAEVIDAREAFDGAREAVADAAFEEWRELCEQEKAQHSTDLDAIPQELAELVASEKVQQVQALGQIAEVQAIRWVRAVNSEGVEAKKGLSEAEKAEQRARQVLAQAEDWEEKTRHYSYDFQLTAGESFQLLAKKVLSWVGLGGLVPAPARVRKVQEKADHRQAQAAEKVAQAAQQLEQATRARQSAQQRMDAAQDAAREVPGELWQKLRAETQRKRDFEAQRQAKQDALAAQVLAKLEAAEKAEVAAQIEEIAAPIRAKIAAAQGQIEELAELKAKAPVRQKKLHLAPHRQPEQIVGDHVRAALHVLEDVETCGSVEAAKAYAKAAHYQLDQAEQTGSKALEEARQQQAKLRPAPSPRLSQDLEQDQQPKKRGSPTMGM